MDDVTAEVLRYVGALRYEDLPGPVIAAAKRNILDTLMVARAGAKADGLDAIVAMAALDAGEGASTVWCRGGGWPATYAAQINAMAAAALDFDSLCLSVHADCVVVPAALAVAEGERQSGKAFLAAYVAGAEVAARLSHASVPPQKGWTHTAVFGVFGAAVASARLLGLSQAKIADAFGICLSLAAGTQQSNIEQTLTKRLQPAIAARNGVFAAQAARAGITGPASVLEGKAGLWSLYQQGDCDKLIGDIGRAYVMLRTGLKKYPVCACSHAAIEACLTMTESRPVPETAIEAVELTLTPFMAYMVGGKCDPALNPVVTAQFSARYAVACALLRGHVNLSDLSLGAIGDAAVKRLADRIVIHTDPGGDGEVAPASVRLKLSGQRERALTINVVPGGPSAPLTDEDFDTKLKDCEAANPFDSSDVGFAALKDAVACLEDLDDLGELAGLLGRQDATVAGRANFCTGSKAPQSN